MDLTKYTDEKLDALQTQVADEQARRYHLATIPQQVAKLNTEYLTADGQTSGDEWVQPQGAFDAYPESWTVTHKSKTWESLTPANVWEPPTQWREVTEPGKGPPDWIQPTGSEDAYNKGDEVTFQGVAYRSVIDANTWSPANYPAGWEKVT